MNSPEQPRKLPPPPPKLLPQNPDPSTHNPFLPAPPKPLIQETPEQQVEEPPTEPPVSEVQENPVQEIEDALLDREHILNTSSGKEDGLDKCPSCGSSDINYKITKKMLVCADCRSEWLPDSLTETHKLSEGIDQLAGRVIGGGAQNITAETDLITIKCQGCGAEVVLNVSNSMNTKCHWCRQILTVNQQIPNGAVPDGILPFLITHAEATAKVSEFVNKRKLLAKGDFIRQFTPETVKPVYMPYMVVDARFDASVSGVGEVLTRKYTETDSDNNTTTYYDGISYFVSRDLTVLVDDLITESSSERSNMDVNLNTNNIINSILPFDTQNLLNFSSHFLKGNTSEKRDMSFDTLDDSVHDQFLTIARQKATNSADKYDRGIRWEQEMVSIQGTRWVSAYLPVWLYSYVEKGVQNGFTHYIAVNGRNGQTMGSVPVSQPKLLATATAASIPFIPISIIALMSL